MTNPHKNEKSIEEQLADFTDRILSEDPRDQDMATLAPEKDVRALEETAQRLKAAFSSKGPDQAMIHSMYRGMMARWRQEEMRRPETLWKTWSSKIVQPGSKWTSRQSRTRFSIVISIASLVVILLIAIPLMNNPGTGLPGASGQDPSIYVLIALGGLILLAVWLYRRRP